MNKFALMSICLLFSGCSAFSTKPVEQQIVYVDRIVQAPPVEPANVAKPDLPIYHLTASSSDEDVSKAYAASITLLLGYSTSLEKALQPYIDAYLQYQKTIATKTP